MQNNDNGGMQNHERDAVRKKSNEFAPDQNIQKHYVCFIKMKQNFRNSFKLNEFCVPWYLQF